MLAVDCEMMDDNIHEFFVFIQRLLFPVNTGERPLRQNDMTILDFLFSDLFKNACIRNIRTDENFLGGSTVLTQMLEDMKEDRRKNPKKAKGKGKESASESSSSSSSSSTSSSSSSTVDLSGDLSNADMKKMLVQIMKKLPKTPEQSESSPNQRVTRSSSGKKTKKQKTSAGV